ncbi:MAG: putative metalloprotease CJM1_0395 family protein [Oceanospirillaceae bacterium]
MELQSSTLNLFNEATSLAVKENSQQLDLAKNSAAQVLKPKVHSLEKEASLFSSDSSSVVRQLVTGSKAAAALYSGSASELSQGKSGSENLTAVNAASQVNTSQSTLQASKQLSQDIKIEQTELKVIQQLSARDREVKAHEQTHAAIGGSYAGAPVFDYTSGPDGRLYATSGEVSIDTSAVENDPKATLEKAQVIIRAALSVSDPSSADRQVAAQAKSLALRAMTELRGSGSEEGVNSAFSDNQVIIEQQQLEREEYLAEVELQQAKQDKNEALAKARRQSADASIEVLKEYNSQINEIQEKLRRLNTQLVDSGAFSKVFPEGFLIDQTA